MKRLFTTLFILSFISASFISASGFAQNANREVIMFEEFNYTIGELPPGWVIDAEQPPQWAVTNTAYAGSTAPELTMNFSFAAGLSRLVSAPVDVTGYTDLKLKMRQYLINYEMDFGEVIGIDITFDGGATWQTLFERTISTLNIAPQDFEFYFTVPQNATELQYAFRFEGNNYAINMWLIDDVSLETVAGNDLVAATLSGNTTPVENVESSYTVEVVNGGSSMQPAYTVKLMKEGGVELASVAGEPIIFAEMQSYTLTWTPDAEDLGNSYLYAVVEFAGDELPENNVSDSMVIVVQTSDIVPVVIGDGEIPMFSLPYNMFPLHSLSQTIYYPEEIGVSDRYLKGILYTSHFDYDKEGIHLQIMLGETDNDNVMDNWLDPSTFTLVFDGLVNFGKGLTETFIPFDNDYLYTGRNLVVYSAKSFSEQVFLTPFMASYDSLSSRSRAADRDSEPFNLMSPPEFGWSLDYYPNITLFYSTDPTSAGNISNDISLQVYPNPANSMLYIMAEEKIQSVKVLNTLGQEIYNRSTTGDMNEMNVSSFNPGIYLLQVYTKKGMVTKKVRIK